MRRFCFFRWELPLRYLVDGTVGVQVGGLVVRGGSGGDVGVLWSSRSNAERGTAAVCWWEEPVVWVRRLRLLLGSLVSGVGMSLVEGLRCRERCDGTVDSLGAVLGWAGGDGGAVADGLVSSMMSAAVSIVSLSNSSAARDPVRLAMWSKGSVWPAIRSAMGSSWLSSLSI